MKITSEPMADRQIGLQIELEEPEIEQHKQRAYRKLVQRYVVPGFRKGKAPRMVLERYIGADTLIQEDMESLLERTLTDAVEDQDLDPVAQPQVTDVESLDPIVFRATVPLKPEVELGAYDEIRVDWEESETSDDQVAEVLENLRRQGTPWEPVDRAVQLGDLLTIDAHGYVDEDPVTDDESDAESGDGDEAADSPGTAEEDADQASDEASDDATAEDAESSDDSTDEPGRRVFVEEQGISYLAQEGVTYPAPGFPEQLVGMVAEETRSFTITVPDDFTVRDLNGKAANFTVTVHEVKEQNPPQLDDEWAKTASLSENETFESLDELRTKISTDLRERSEQQAHADYEEKVLAALEEAATVSFPPVMVELEVDRLLQDQDERMRGMGISLAAYAANTGQGVEEIRESVRPQAEQRVRRAILIEQLAEAEGIDPAEDAVDEEIQKAIDSQPDDDAQEQARQVFESDAARESIRRRLVARGAVDILNDIARGTRAVDADEDAVEDADEESVEEPQA